MYRIEFSRLAEKQFYKLPRSVQERVKVALERILIRPHAYVTRLVGEPFFRLRVGDYRVILDIDGGRLLILVIHMGRRESIYR